MMVKPINKNSFIRDCKLSARAQNVLYNNAEAFGVPRIFPITISNLKVLHIG